jgi:hypothetical protein
MPDLAISVGAMSKGWRRLFIPAPALVLVVSGLPTIRELSRGFSKPRAMLAAGQFIRVPVIRVPAFVFRVESAWV